MKIKHPTTTFLYLPIWIRLYLEQFTQRGQPNNILFQICSYFPQKDKKDKFVDVTRLKCSIKICLHLKCKDNMVCRIIDSVMCNEEIQKKLLIVIKLFEKACKCIAIVNKLGTIRLDSEFLKFSNFSHFSFFYPIP